MDPTTAAYLGRVVETLEERLGEPGLVAVWLSGSLATGDFRPEASDVDLLVAAAGGLSDRAKEDLARGLSHAELPCPAHGLDLLIYRHEELASPSRTPRYEFSIATGREWRDEVSQGGEYGGGILDLRLVRARGQALLGPPAREVIGPIPEAWVAEELKHAMRWHMEKVHDPFHDPTGANAVLNTCRALHYLLRRVLVSKTAGAEWFLAREPVPVVARALEARRTGGREPLDRREVVDFLERVLEKAPDHPDQT